MIIIDFNNVAATAIMGQTNNGKLPIVEDEFKITFLEKIRSLRSSHKERYGDVVIVSDSRTSWRKKFFPHYKATRAKQKSYTNLDWTQAYKVFQAVKEDLKNYFPYKMVEVEGAEGDDVVGVLARLVKENVLIVSSDTDFTQLHCDRVQQLSPRSGHLVVCDTNPHHALMIKILEGDRTDGIPNVLSDGDTFINEEKRQNKLTVKWIEQLTSPEFVFPTHIKTNYDRNKLMIDLTMTPEPIVKDVLNTYINSRPAKRDKMFSYFVKNRMVNLTPLIQDF